jgi:hypothetical protein
MYDGVIIDARQEVILSQLMLEPAFDAVIYKPTLDTATRIILPAHRVRSFRYFDVHNNINRQFISIRQDGVYRFYEVVIFGEVKVVRRLKKGVLSWEADEGHDYDFFCSFRNELVDLKKFKAAVVPHLVQVYGQDLADFIDQNRFRFHDVAAVFAVVKRCNELTARYHSVATR